jgi:uroporphyrin-3 C-methyltransferase
MDMDMPDADPIAPSAPAVTPAAPRRGVAWMTLLAMLALVGSSYSVWRTVQLDRAADATQANTGAVQAELDALNRRIDQTNRDRDLLRQRLDDIGAVNKSLREEVLGVTERARVLEDAVANLAEKRLSGHDALLLDEAEMLLRLAQDRYALFGDAPEAVQAYGLADETIAAIDDPAFSTVRETLAVERKALMDQRQLAAGAGVAELERLRSALSSLPLARDALDTQTAKPDESRLWQVLGKFVRISHDTAAPSGARDRSLARALVSLDLRSAEAALLARDMGAFRAALLRAQAIAREAFDAQAAGVKDLNASLERMAGTETPPTPAVLGAALKEMRNLRSTHRLQGNAPKSGAAAQ